jgi:hypothetical protein
MGPRFKGIWEPVEKKRSERLDKDVDIWYDRGS